jgi:DNA polymerase (family 10)
MKTRKHLISLLEELSLLENSFFKSRAYKNAIISLNNITDQEFLDWDDFTDLDGIGLGINKKIIEYKSTGSISKLISLRQEHEGYLDERLYKIRKSFITKRIPFELAAEYISNLKELINSEYITVAGSYRRKKTLIGDIDILVNSDYYKEICSTLESEYEVLSSGDYKSSYLIDKVNNIQLDVISVTPNEFPYQLLYLTGSKEFNIRMRSLAKRKGYRLNQEGLYNSNTGSYVEGLLTEEDVFRFLGMEYVKPENR